MIATDHYLVDNGRYIWSFPPRPYQAGRQNY